VTTAWFGGIYGSAVTPSDVYIGAVADQGLNVVNAFRNCDVEVILCNAHRLNTATKWALGLAGSDTTNENPEMKALLGKCAALVGYFSHSSSSNDQLRTIQADLVYTGDEDEAEVLRHVEDVLNLVRRNDTRWVGNHAMIHRLLRTQRALLL
jgi:hypothetical protein